MMFIGDMLRRDTRLYTRKAGIIEEEKSFSFSELNVRANRLANALLDLGMRKGDRIAFMGNNCHEFGKARLAGYKKPRSIDFVKELLRNAASKVDKAGLKKIYREKYSGN
jgi:acyl-CoA synthetase (AMP-forming)/AMP-acid ligase II